MESIHLTIESSSPRDTKAWGRRLASVLSGGELLAFEGDLGVGKTCFIKGLARGLNLREQEILSPTFTMIQEHHGRVPLYHIDLYRLEHVGLDELGLREYLFSSAIAAVEWFERLNEAQQLERLSIRLIYASANRRTIEFSAVGERYDEILARLKARFG
jgi:tRNA threonylcarbamoyladenosine biosynthesis protein TsaE